MARMKSGRYGSARVQQSKPLLPLNLNIQNTQKIDEEILRNVVQDTIKETDQIKQNSNKVLKEQKNEKVLTEKKIKKTKKNSLNQK